MIYFRSAFTAFRFPPPDAAQNVLPVPGLGDNRFMFFWVTDKGYRKKSLKGSTYSIPPFRLITISRSSLISSIAYRGPSLPSPDPFAPP